MCQFCAIIKILSVASLHDKHAVQTETCTHTRYRKVRMRGDADTLLLIQKIPSGDALGASDSCMHTFIQYTHTETHYNSATRSRNNFN